MNAAYFFRVDGAKDNDAFFDAQRTSAEHVYAGLDFRVGSTGWIPDFVRVVVEDPGDKCCLTLVELESTEPAALASCRKYLPENSTTLVSRFSEYLYRVVLNYHSNADPREREFAKLKSILSEATQVKVTTAWPLRSATVFLEELPLIDQPTQATQGLTVEKDRQRKPYTFEGVLRLSARSKGPRAKHPYPRCLNSPSGSQQCNSALLAARHL